MTTYTPPPEPGRTASRRSRPVPLVIGILLALVGFPLLLGGLGLGWAMATQRDDDGFFSTPTEQLTTETVALSSEVVNLGEAGPDDWWAVVFPGSHGHRHNGRMTTERCTRTTVWPKPTSRQVRPRP
jgi:hypothetical protein